LSILGHSFTSSTSTTSTEDEAASNNNNSNDNNTSPTNNDASNNNTHLMIALAHSGAPASIRIASIKLPPLQSFARGEFFLSGQHLTVNSKHPIAKMTTLSIAKGTSLIAVLTRDNFVQVFCSAFSSSASISAIAHHFTTDSNNNNSQDSRRRQRTVAGEKEEEQQQQQKEQHQNDWRTNSLSSKCIIVSNINDDSSSSSNNNNNNSCWPLVTPRMKCPFPPVFTTLICSVAAPAATLSNPVDDIVLMPRTSSTVSTNQKQPIRNNIQSVSLLVSLGNGSMQTFSILGSALGSSSELARLEKTEPRSVLISSSTDYAFMLMSASAPLVIAGGEGKCLLAQTLGSTLVVLRPKKFSPHQMTFGAR
jgi:hypothetical protein